VEHDGQLMFGGITTLPPCLYVPTTLTQTSCFPIATCWHCTIHQQEFFRQSNTTVDTNPIKANVLMLEFEESSPDLTVSNKSKSLPKLWWKISSINLLALIRNIICLRAKTYFTLRLSCLHYYIALSWHNRRNTRRDHRSCSTEALGLITTIHPLVPKELTHIKSLGWQVVFSL
jgi:hypothetical protein